MPSRNYHVADYRAGRRGAASAWTGRGPPRARPRRSGWWTGAEPP